MPRQQNEVQNQNMTIGNLLIENVEKFKYLELTVASTNDIREEINCRINLGNACYYSLEKILSSRLKVNKLHIKQLYYQLYCMVVKLGLSL